MKIYNPKEDPTGERAMRLAFDKYESGMNLLAADKTYEAIDDFRASELFHIHAATLGWVQSFLGLGYIYAYNRSDGMWDGCILDVYSTGEGTHLGGSERDFELPDLFVPIVFTPEMTREERAFTCFSLAAEKGHPEGMYKLGDMYRQGMGCEIDYEKAFESYKQAEEYCEFSPPYLWGSVAMRLGTCYEMGEGCQQNFARALECFKEAEQGLNMAVNSGDTMYKKNLGRVRNAIARITQELDGSY